MAEGNRFMKWLRIFMLMAAFAATATHAQMVGSLENDMPLLDVALVHALSATGNAEQDNSRLAMEELYRLWRMFRRMNIEGHPDDPQITPDLEMVEARLWAASQLIDNSKLSDAHAELDAARIVLLVVRERYGLEPAR